MSLLFHTTVMMHPLVRWNVGRCQNDVFKCRFILLCHSERDSQLVADLWFTNSQISPGCHKNLGFFCWCHYTRLASRIVVYMAVSEEGSLVLLSKWMTGEMKRRPTWGTEETEVGLIRCWWCEKNTVDSSRSSWSVVNNKKKESSRAAVIQVVEFNSLLVSQLTERPQC